MAEWLFSSGAGAVSHDFAAREEARFGSGAAEAALAETPILPGIWRLNRGFRGPYGEPAAAGVRRRVRGSAGPARGGATAR